MSKRLHSIDETGGMLGLNGAGLDKCPGNQPTPCYGTLCPAVGGGT